MFRSSMQRCNTVHVNGTEGPDVNTENYNGLRTVKHFYAYALDYIFTHYLAAFI